MKGYESVYRNNSSIAYGLLHFGRWGLTPSTSGWGGSVLEGSYGRQTGGHLDKSEAYDILQLVREYEPSSLTLDTTQPFLSISNAHFSLSET